MRRSSRRVLEATMGAAVLGGIPSTVLAAAKARRPSAALDHAIDATARIGVLVPPFQPGLSHGLVAHTLISAVAGSVMAGVLPQRHSLAWGAGAGLLMGWVNLGMIGRRIPAIAELPLGPQLADNIAFGIAFAAIADRS